MVINYAGFRCRRKNKKHAAPVGNITCQPHRFGGFEFKSGKREIGHVHGNYLVDIPFTKKIKNEIISDGLASVHHILPESGWISKYLKTPRDVDTAIKLLRRSFALALEQRKKELFKIIFFYPYIKPWKNY